MVTSYVTLLIYFNCCLSCCII